MPLAGCWPRTVYKIQLGKEHSQAELQPERLQGGSSVTQRAAPQVGGAGAELLLIAAH